MFRYTSKMADSKRTFFVGGNWKLNSSRDFIKSHVGALNNFSYPAESQVEIVVAPPDLYISAVHHFITSRIKISGQDSWKQGSGAFTGESSADMLKELGASYVILGHSERRNIFKETDELVGEKTEYALSKGLGVIACVGELLSEREEGKTEEVVIRQLQHISNHVKDWSKVVIAYEPVWAIGTGKTASPSQAQEVHAVIRKWLSEKVTSAVANSTRIIYGGSVNAGNCNELAKEKDIDGFLVGGASLKANEFNTIISSSSQKN